MTTNGKLALLRCFFAEYCIFLFLDHSFYFIVLLILDPKYLDNLISNNFCQKMQIQDLHRHI